MRKRRKNDESIGGTVPLEFCQRTFVRRDFGGTVIRIVEIYAVGRRDCSAVFPVFREKVLSLALFHGAQACAFNQGLAGEAFSALS